MVSTPEEGGLKEERGADNNTIINDSTLFNIIPLQPKKIYTQRKVICGCECCISDKSMHEYLLSWCNLYVKSQIPNQQFTKQKVW